MTPLLIVDDETSTRDGLQTALGGKYDVYTAPGADAAFDLMKQIEFEVILTDLRMVGKSGLKVIDQALALPQKPVVIMMTAYGNIETAVEAMRHGAADFLQKPISLDRLELTIARALKTKKLEAENLQLHERLDEKYNFENFVGNSAPLKKLIDQIKLVAPSRASVLLVGPTGTGKELAAQALHQNSPRARGPFVAVHCASLPANLLESELFGHEKGAFTGALEKRVGRFEAADGGTLFLDEIGDIDAATQVKILRFLETKTFDRLGSNEPVSVDVRLVAATNRDLEQMVREGKFREDLYYRLNVVRLVMPPLSARRGDIPLLLDYFLKFFAKENGVAVPTISPDALKALVDYSWGGNVRELRNFCERMAVFKRGGEIGLGDLEGNFLAVASSHPLTPSHGENGRGNNDWGSTPNPVSSEIKTLSFASNEKLLIREALERAHGNKSKAAELLGISRRTLHRKLKERGC